MKLITFLTFACCCSVGLYSQSSPLRLSLDDAIRIAVEKNHDLAVARLENEKADKQVKEAFGLALPSIDFNATYSRALKLPVFFLPDFDDPESGKVIPIKIGSANAFDINVTASQVLFNSAVFTGVGTAKVYSEAAAEMYRAKKSQTVANVRKSFYQVLLAAESRSILRETVKNAEDNLRNARVLAGSGLISDYDALRAEVRLENLKPDLMKSEDGYHLALNNLRIAIGLDGSEQLEVEGKLEPVLMDEGIIESALEEVLQSNPTVRAMRLQAEVNEAIVKIEQSDYLPTLAAFGNYQFQAQKDQFNFSRSDFVGSSVVGLNLSLNIFKGFQTGARVEQATLDQRKAEEQVLGMESVLRAQVESMILRLRWAQKQIGVHEKTIEQAERGYRIASTRFSEGSGTQLELNDAQLALNQSKVNRVEAIYQYLLAATDLEEVLGIVPKSLQEENK